MTNTIIVKDLLMKDVVRNLDKKASIFPVANQQYTGDLKQQWDTVTVQTLPSFDMDLGQTAWDDITVEDWAITSDDLTVDQVFTKALKIKDLEAIQSNLSLRSQLTSRLAESMARAFDQFVAQLAMLNVNSSNALVPWVPATETSSTTFATVESMRVKLEEQNVEAAWLFVNPAFKSLLVQSSAFDNTDTWAWIAIKWKVWQMWSFTVVMTNNLPYRIKLSIAGWDVSPNDTLTLTIWGTAIVWTYVASPTAAWDIDIWGTATITWVNTVAAINWTTPGSLYVEVSAANRKLMTNALVTATTVSAWIWHITAAKSITTAESMDNTTLWSAWRVLIWMDSFSVNFVKQLDWFKIKDAEKWFYSRLLIENAYWWAVFTENAKRIVTKDITNGATA